MAFSAAARAVFLVVRSDEDTGRRLFLPAKNNLGPDRGAGLAFTLSETKGSTVISWEIGVVQMSADEALAASVEKKDGRRSEALEIAKTLIADMMRDGVVRAADVEKAAAERGISPKTLRNAKNALRVVSRKDGAGYLWVAPQGEQLEMSDEVPF